MGNNLIVKCKFNIGLESENHTNNNNMPSRHKVYEYGNIAVEELFEINISEKVHIQRK